VTRGRVLVAGWVNSAHVLAWGDALLELGYEVHLAGQHVDNWPPPHDPGRFASVHALDPGSIPGIRDRRIGHGLARVVRELRPDLVHAHWASGYAWMAARARARPLVTSAWGSDLLLPNRRLALRARRALRASELVFADSAYVAGAAMRIAGTDLKVEVVQWGVDLDRYRPDRARREAARRRLGLDNRPTVLSTRALDPIYNPHVLLEAFAVLRRRLPEARLVLKHPGASLPPVVEEQLSDLGLDDATLVIGFVDQEELVDLYRAADVYVSIPSSDSSPRSVWEAIACGVPTVISDLPWAHEVLRDGEHAVLVSVDAEAVAEALERILSDRQAATGLAAAARGVAVEKIDRRQQLARIDALYRELLGDRG
jgi:glycosyltransferase involved in cell wall biosynthesis